MPQQATQAQTRYRVQLARGDHLPAQQASCSKQRDASNEAAGKGKLRRSSHSSSSRSSSSSSRSSGGGGGGGSGGDGGGGGQQGARDGYLSASCWVLMDTTTCTS